MSLLKFLGFGKDEPSDAAAGTETVRKIVRQLDAMDTERARFTAAFAYILSRVAGADSKFSEAEVDAMEKIVTEHAGVPSEQAVLIVQIAKQQQKLFGGTEDFLVTREFERIATREHCLALVDCLYAVAAAEQLVSLVEDNEIRRIADQLKLSHEDWIEIRLRYRDRLAVLQKS